jgi:hypothetical protein
MQKSKADFKKRGGAYFSAGLNVMYGDARGLPGGQVVNCTNTKEG